MLLVTQIFYKDIVLQPSVLFTQLTVTHNTTTHTRSVLSCAPRSSGYAKVPQCYVTRKLANLLTFRFFLIAGLRYRRLHLDGNVDVHTKRAA